MLFEMMVTSTKEIGIHFCMAIISSDAILVPNLDQKQNWNDYRAGNSFHHYFLQITELSPTTNVTMLDVENSKTLSAFIFKLS